MAQQVGGVLCLVPTPLAEGLMLEPVALARLRDAPLDSIFAVEEIAIARRRFVQWGIGRECFSQMIEYNEHTRSEESLRLISHLKVGRSVFLISDSGLPAFCDPGVELVDLAHRNGIKVTATPFCNSVSLAVSLSGMVRESFTFEGYPPSETDRRKQWYRETFGGGKPVVFVDTPYRLKKVVEEIVDELHPGTRVFFAMNLNSSDEFLINACVSDLLKAFEKSPVATGKWKAEFICVVSR